MGENMSSIGALSGLSVLSFQMSNRAMLDAAAADEGDEDGEFMLEPADNLEIESESEDADYADGEAASPIGGQIDAWG
jgi:hypothetical protein